MIGVRDSKIRKKPVGRCKFGFGKNLTTAYMSLNRMEEIKMGRKQEESRRQLQQTGYQEKKLKGKGYSKELRRGLRGKYIAKHRFK